MVGVVGRGPKGLGNVLLPYRIWIPGAIRLAMVWGVVTTLDGSMTLPDQTLHSGPVPSIHMCMEMMECVLHSGKRG
jgi:hypothetical protein